MKFLPFVNEAIDALGYLRAEAAVAVAAAMEHQEGQHPRAVGLFLRRLGTQISREEKKALRLRANAFLSRAARAALTEKGEEDPAHAFTVTILRAHLSYFRRRNIDAAEQTGFLIKVSGMFADCPGCLEQQDKKMSCEEARCLPPSACSREACGLMCAPWKDWMAGVT